MRASVSLVSAALPASCQRVRKQDCRPRSPRSLAWQRLVAALLLRRGLRRLGVCFQAAQRGCAPCASAQPGLAAAACASVVLAVHAAQAANYLNIKSLLDLTCLTVANMIKGAHPHVPCMQPCVECQYSCQYHQVRAPACLLNMQPCVGCLCRGHGQVVCRVRTGKTPEEIRKTFNIPVRPAARSLRIYAAVLLQRERARRCGHPAKRCKLPGATDARAPSRAGRADCEVTGAAARGASAGKRACMCSRFPLVLLPAAWAQAG